MFTHHLPCVQQLFVFKETFYWFLKCTSPGVHIRAQYSTFQWSTDVRLPFQKAFPTPGNKCLSFLPSNHPFPILNLKEKINRSRFYRLKKEKDLLLKMLWCPHFTYRWEAEISSAEMLRRHHRKPRGLARDKVPGHPRLLEGLQSYTQQQNGNQEWDVDPSELHFPEEMYLNKVKIRWLSLTGAPRRAALYESKLSVRRYCCSPHCSP